MLSTLSITAPAPGMIFLNGRFAGEADVDAPLLLPCAGFGAIYLEYLPLEDGWLPMARRIVLSGGRPVALPDGIFAILWPDRLLELELAPPPFKQESSEIFSLDGLNCRLCRGTSTHLEIAGHRYPLPDGARRPHLFRTDAGLALLGPADDGQYLLTLSSDASSQTGFLTADRIERESGDILRAVVLRRDVAGHASEERWQMSPAGLQLMSSGAAWEDGLPRPPASAEECALAAVEAALLGCFDEADRYLSPQLRAGIPLENITDVCQSCLPMKYARPEGRPCIGLLRIEGENFASVQPLYYQAQLAESGWLLTGLEWSPTD